MSELSSDDLVAIVGPIGEAAVAEIIRIRIRKDELVAAHERAVKDRNQQGSTPDRLVIKEGILDRNDIHLHLHEVRAGARHRLSVTEAEAVSAI
jgi:hypothetical protein